MQAAELDRAIAAAMSIASSSGLAARDAIVLHDSNKLTLRLLPCDLVARVALGTDHVALFEIELAQRLAEFGSPVAALDPRVEPCVHERDGFAVTLWTFYGPQASPELSPAEYADAMQRLHAGMRQVDVPAPHVTDRIERARRLVASREESPALADADRELLSETLGRLGRVLSECGGAGQLLHGEPHPGNVLATTDGVLFVDLETCCRGPVEFDLAHAPVDVGEHYPSVDHDLLRECRILVLAMVTAWRWDRRDRFPDGPRLGRQWLAEVRAAVGSDAP